MAQSWLPVCSVRLEFATFARGAYGNTDGSSAVTLGREMLEAIRSKFPDTSHDDLVWPILSPNGSALPPPIPAKFQNNKDEPNFDGECHEYWKAVSEHHSAAKFDPELLSRSTAERLPHKWTVVSISVSEDRRTIFVSRRRPHRQPLLFSIPLEGRREGEEEAITFQGALEEFEEIIRLSDETTRSAEQVTKTDRRQRCNWWAERTKLDTRLRELLENIEFCWLGAFKVRSGAFRPIGLVSYILLDHPIPSSGYTGGGYIEFPGALGGRIPTRVGFGGQEATKRRSTRRFPAGVFRLALSEVSIRGVGRSRLFRPGSIPIQRGSYRNRRSGC